MLVMPILVKSSKDKNVNKIYNVMVKLNSEHAFKAKEATILKGIGASDILINGNIYGTDSRYNKEDPSSIISFIRDNNYKQEATHFLVTTKYNNDSDTYDVYKVANLPRKVTAGLDNLYSRAVKDMMNEVPGNNKPEYLNLKDIGIDNNITDDKLSTLKIIMDSNSISDKKETMQINGVSSLYNTVEYMNKFDFEVINSLYEDDIKNVISSFDGINNHDNSLVEYYNIAYDNRDVYKKLNSISKIVNKKPLAIIKKGNNQKVLQKRPEE